MYLYPRATKILSIGDFKMDIEFDNGEVRQFKASSVWDDPFWRSLKNRFVFETACVDGISISWINDVDISPEDLYELSTKNG